MRTRGEGPIPSRIMIVGEASTDADDRVGQAFAGPAGQELNRLLHEAGIMRSECYCTNVVKVRPPGGQLSAFVARTKKEISAQHSLLRDRYVTKEVHEGVAELMTEIEMVQPNIIIACGNIAMWALTGQWSVLKWRGSQMKMDFGCRAKVIPTLHPQAVQRQWELRGVVLGDFRRVKRHMTSREYDNIPAWNFIIRPTFAGAMNTISSLRTRLDVGEKLWLDFDIETRPGVIDCIGFSWSATDAICIPFIARGRPEGYWSAAEEPEIVYALYKLLTHPNAQVRWQNGLYDAQYVQRFWHFIPRGAQDTMISQHSVFAALPKGLSFLASMYADYYYYWKEEGKIASDVLEDVRWKYNLQDCVYTRAVGEALTQTAEVMGLAEVERKQQALFWPVLSAMVRGVRVFPQVKADMAVAIEEELSTRQAFLFQLLGHSINPASPKQMQALFYDDLKQPPVLKRIIKDGRTHLSPTCDDEALSKIAAREPIIRPVCNAIADIRTLNKFLGDFVGMPLDTDGRMRCSFNIAGDAAGKSAPYSYRLSSSKNAFGSGGNLQTIPSEKSKSSGKAAARGSMDFTLPNIRSMYGPDPGFTFFDMDLDRADLQVVVRESGEADWMLAMDQGVDMHLLNAYMIEGRSPPPLEELIETHPKYWDHRGPLKHAREFAKVFCHATDYGGGAKTVAAHTGRTVHEIDKAQKYWFGIHPGIETWHRRTEAQINRHRFIENRWGYRWYIFDRLDGLLPEALAWLPQSTIGILINRIWLEFYNRLPEVQVLLQVHDSLAGQFPTHRAATLLPLMAEASRIPIPYDPPLIIPVGIKTSAESWGACV